MASEAQGRQVSTRFLKLLIFLMFAMFAMTTDSVGTIIPSVIDEFELGMTAAGSFHYASMSGIGIAAILLGFLADRFGRKSTILLGLALFGTTSALFTAGNAFGLFVLLLFVSGLGIGIFKSGALALIGEISTSTRQHASNMNLVEGFFGVGAIVGPALVTVLMQGGMSWKWLYLIAAALCALLVAGTAVAPFPRSSRAAEQKADPRAALRMLGDPHALFFAALLVLYVAAEAAVYVWAPTYFAGYQGPMAWLAAFVVSVFFILRAAGRFLGAWLLSRCSCWADRRSRSSRCRPPACSCRCSIRPSTPPASAASTSTATARSPASCCSSPAWERCWRRWRWGLSATSRGASNTAWASGPPSRCCWPSCACGIGVPSLRRPSSRNATARITPAPDPLPLIGCAARTMSATSVCNSARVADEG